MLRNTRERNKAVAGKKAKWPLPGRRRNGGNGATTFHSEKLFPPMEVVDSRFKLIWEMILGNSSWKVVEGSLSSRVSS